MVNVLHSFSKILFLLVLLPLTGVYAQRYNIDWVNGIGRNSSESITSVTLDEAANVYAVGTIIDTLDFDPGSNVLSLQHSRNAPASTFIYKTNTAGKPLWVKEFRGFSSGSGLRGSSISFAGNQLYIAGYFEGTVDFDPGPGASNLNAAAGGTFITKLDTAGNLMWARHIDATPNCSFYNVTTQVATDASGNVYVAGIIFGNDADSIDFDPGAGVATYPTINGGSTFLLKLDASGNYVWARTFNGVTGSDFCASYGVAVDHSGNVILTGEYQGDVDFEPASASGNLTSVGSGNGNSDVFIVKLNSAGTHLWSKSLGGSGYDIGYGIAADVNDNIYTTGVYWQTANPNDADFDPGGGTFLLTSTDDNIFISSLNADGDFRWARQLGANGIDQGLSVSVKNGIVYTSVFISADDPLGLGHIDFDPNASVYHVTAPVVGQSYLGISLLDTSGSFVWGGLAGPPMDAGASIVNSYISSDASGSIYLGGDYSLLYFSQPQMVDFDPGPDSFKVLYGAGVGGPKDIFLLKLSPCIERQAVNARGCDRYSFRGQEYLSGGSFTDTSHIPGICDTIFTLSLELGQTTIDTLPATVCDSFRFNDRVYTATGFYSNLFAAAAGCDSTVVIHLTISGVTLDTAVARFGNTLVSQATGAGYQWVDCANGYAPVSGATSSSFTPAENGQYAVIVTNEGACSDTSYCYTITGLTSIEESGANHLIDVYPNPAISTVYIDTQQSLRSATLKVLNLQGQVLLQQEQLAGKHFQVDVAQFASGIYILDITEGNYATKLRLVKK